MKGIYLTQEGKAEIEAKIALYEFCNLLPHQVGELKIYKEIRSSANIIHFPTEDKGWECEQSPTGHCDYMQEDGTYNEDYCRYCGKPEERK